MKNTINLLDDLLRDGRPQPGKWFLFAAAGVGILAPFLVWGLQVWAAGRLDPQIVQMRSTRDHLTQEVAQRRQVLQESDARQARLTEERIQTAGIPWSEVLRELSLVVPDGVWLTQFEEIAPQENTTDIAVRIQGVAASQGGVAELLVRLETAHHLAQPQLVYSQRNSGVSGRLNFEVHCIIVRASFSDQPQPGPG
ncbi:MAG: PilN domain-containing protein [Nitrospirae bacterium]|nr:PilN domain-containing protein [Nitrospirota bacterium]